MSVSTGALIVGALGLIYGLSATRWSGERGQRFAVIGAFGLLAAAIVLIVIPWAMGRPW
ncbi:hypothetical protein BJY21_001691 [Kineosphaera limosa]|uniref:Uncharacterized protein n=1 Tax=Kineosphaera limosa NBRC 100340 TaxID=1184609 RepID=K6WSE3_9MICO|nr:hypothetical protein [Kineosphaera limosa]NYE00507.1 hypothetical protein [Kineosphaera limosa]GAB95027.1 hypothetical protein KILIM_015_00890 [Kineosphaera limosa NBRC 100340]